MVAVGDPAREGHLRLQLLEGQRTFPPDGELEERIGEEAAQTVGGGQRGVGDDDAREALGCCRHHAQPDQTAPVLAEEGDVREIEGAHQLQHVIDLHRIAVRILVGELVRAPEADEVRRDDAIARVDEDGDHLAEEIAPSRFAVDQQQRLAVRRRIGAHVDVVQPDIAHLPVVGRVGPIRQTLETGIRRPQHAG